MHLTLGCKVWNLQLTTCSPKSLQVLSSLIQGYVMEMEVCIQSIGFYAYTKQLLAQGSFVGRQNYIK